jgi:hypothetical protein
LRNGWSKKSGTKIDVWQRFEIHSRTVSVYNILGKLVKLYFTIAAVSDYQRSMKKLKNFLAYAEDELDRPSKPSSGEGNFL